MLKTYFLAAIGDETAVADGIEATEPACLEDLLARVLGDDAGYILLAASLYAVEELLRGLTVEQVSETVQKYIDPMKMYYVVAGDAATQMKELKKLGFGEPVLLQ